LADPVRINLPGDALAVYSDFERSEKFRRPLHLIEGRPLGQVGHKTHRVGASGSQRHLVVETEVRIPSRIADQPRQRGFPALSGPMNQNHGRIRKSLGQARASQGRL
jgi:hypothetical protein